MESMKLKYILRGIPSIEVRGSKEIEISGVSADSRTVAPGNVFIAKKGEKYDGGQFIGQAVEAGAAAIVTDFYDPFVSLTQIICPSPGGLEASLAARFFRRASTELFVVGVTGTKGKTTTSYLIRHLLEGLHEATGLIGTVETIIGDNRQSSRLTTLDAIANQKLLREMVNCGCKNAVMEVSSHGLEQGRVDEIAFDIALFTNLYPDHLDYHPNIEAYALAKAKLFEHLKGLAIVNADSPWSDFMKGGKRRVTFGIEKSADVRAQDIRLSRHGAEFSVGGVLFKTPLMGRFNVYNILGAIAVGLEKGASLNTIAEILATTPQVPGRLERVSNQQGIAIFVDYAHNGEAMENVLVALREMAPKRIILVFGAGGNRDPRRRSGMGKVAEKGADLSIVTTDNPRNEDSKEIEAQVLSGFRHPEKVLLEPDRKKAIELAIQTAKTGDFVLIAGKGHEKVQIFAHQTVPFDDVAVAKEALQM